MPLCPSRFRSFFALCVLCFGAGVAPAAEPQSAGITPAVTQSPGELIEQGMQFESQRRWADALNHYEQALRQFPQHEPLARRFDFARLHYSIARRYADPSFVGSIQSLSVHDASELLAELLLKIETHYVVEPPWPLIAQRSLDSLAIALGEQEFLTRNGLRGDSPQIRELVAQIPQFTQNRPAADRSSVYRLAIEVSDLAATRIGLSRQAVLLEFTSAATCGLDNYSAYLTGDQLREINSQIEGNFVGLGVELKPADGALMIDDVITGSPAQRAGIVAGDRIEAIDGRSIAALPAEAAYAMLSGEEGSYLTLAIVDRAGTSRSLNIRREHVEVPSLEGARIVDPQAGVAYLRIPVFQKATSRDLEAALWDLHSKGMQSLIIDLRGNPGGLLTSSVEVADKFVPQGNIVMTRGRSPGEDFDYQAHRGGTWRVPLVVLIDGDSASASEIFAAAIRDSHRGTVIGDRSFGKGTVQGIFPLGYAGAGIRLTTAKFLSPLGQPISQVGVQPDIVVPQATGASQGQRVVAAFRGIDGDASATDPVLARAIEAAKVQVALR